MARTHGARNYKPSLEDQKTLLRRLRSQADKGDSAAIAGYLELVHNGVIDRIVGRTQRRLAD